MIFVDTGAWFAAFVPNDADHAAAAAWLATNNTPLLTTDYVLDELLTLLRMRHEYTRALRLGESLLRQDLALLHWVSRDEVFDAWETYRRFSDKHWSFTELREQDRDDPARYRHGLCVRRTFSTVRRPDGRTGSAVTGCSAVRASSLRCHGV